MGKSRNNRNSRKDRPAPCPITCHCICHESGSTAEHIPGIYGCPGKVPTIRVAPWGREDNR